ncbi:MAG TPA: SPOR domain-containing protein, partial [Thermoanaerobaculia bacterium]|nr:SPOR domain-containing protein [Thermoanaerobaculia bacterium]
TDAGRAELAANPNVASIAAAAPRAAAPASASVPAAAATTSAPAPEPEAAAASGSGTEEAPVFEDREAGLPEAKTTGAPQAPSRTEIAGGAPASAAKKPAGPAPGAESAKPAPEAKRAEAAKSAEEGAKTSPERRAEHGYFVQILSTSSKAEASRWKEKLAARSWRTAAVTSVPSKKGTLWRVRVGPYPDAAQAKKAAAKISAEFRQKAWVAPQ